MARSPKDDPIYNDMQWNYRTEAAENCAPGVLNERKQPPISSNSGVMNDNSVYTNANYPNDVYLGKHAFNVQAGDTAATGDDKVPFNNMPNVNRVNRQNFGNAMLNLGNGQLVRVFYDENNQQLIFPVSEQYDPFNHNQWLRDMPLQSPQPSHMFTLNQDYSMNNNVHVQPPTTIPNNTFSQDNSQNVPTSNFLKEVLGNWEPNSTGTYSPFGQNYPLNHPDAPSFNLHPTPVIDPINPVLKPENSPKRNENSPLADTSNKKRIVAEVKPMRPTYSDVLAKNMKNNTQSEAARKTKPQNFESKPVSNKTSKPEKPFTNLKHDENKTKSEKKLHTNTISSGSESGDINIDDMDKHQKPSKKSKNRKSNISRRWSSLDDIANEEEIGYTSNESQFVFIETQAEKPLKKEKKSDNNKSKSFDKSSTLEDDFKLDDEDHQSQFVYQDGQAETKSRRKKDRNHHKAAKPSQDKKKVAQTKLRRNKPGYIGLAQNYFEHWVEVTWKAVIWFFYLLSDICRMSAHLSFDL